MSKPSPKIANQPMAMISTLNIVTPCRSISSARSITGPPLACALVVAICCFPQDTVLVIVMKNVTSAESEPIDHVPKCIDRPSRSGGWLGRGMRFDRQRQRRFALRQRRREQGRERHIAVADGDAVAQRSCIVLEVQHVG